MEGERLQENRPQGFLKGLLLGALILAALGLGVSLFGPGGAGGERGSSPAAGPALPSAACLPRKLRPGRPPESPKTHLALRSNYAGAS